MKLKQICIIIGSKSFVNVDFKSINDNCVVVHRILTVIRQRNDKKHHVKQSPIKILLNRYSLVPNCRGEEG